MWVVQPWHIVKLDSARYSFVCQFCRNIEFSLVEPLKFDSDSGKSNKKHIHDAVFDPIKYELIL
jgi:hypothetical protein